MIHAGMEFVMEMDHSQVVQEAIDAGEIDGRIPSNMKGRKHTEETKALMSKVRKGRPKSDSWKQSMKKPKSDSWKQSMRKPKSKEHAAKLAAHLAKHKMGWTPEQRAEASRKSKVRAKCPHCDFESTKSHVTRHIQREH